MILSHYFNSHAHVERDMLLPREVNFSSSNFNSHAHVERDSRL